MFLIVNFQSHGCAKQELYFFSKKNSERLQMTDIYGQLNDDRRLPTLPENLSSPPVFSGIPVARS